MQVWAFANQKGGVGKTTSAVSVAGLLATRGMHCLLVDMDPHGSLTSYFKLDPDATDGGLFALFENAIVDRGVDPQAYIRATGVEHLDLLPASTALATLDRRLGTQSGMGLVMQKMVALLSRRYDYILLDCPPVLGILLVNALAACDLLLIPVQTEHLALKGLERMLDTIAMVTRSRRYGLPYKIVPTLYDQRTRASRDAMEQLLAQHRTHLWPSPIPVDTKFRDASRLGLPLCQVDANSHGNLAYEALLDVLLVQRMNQHHQATAP